MRKVIFTGEFALNIVFDRTSAPMGTIPGGRIVNAAALLARSGLPAIMVGEASADQAGDSVVKFVKDAGVDVACVDRYTEGVTPVQLHFPDNESDKFDVIRYESYPEDCFDVIWPRFDPGDIMVFGGFLSIDPRARERVTQLLNAAHERGCLMVYLPGFLPSRMPRITRVMPSILENLEISHLTVTRSQDLDTIFGTKDDARVYGHNISFYCDKLINSDASSQELHAFGTTTSQRCESHSRNCRTMLWNAAATAGIVEYIYHNVPTTADINAISSVQIQDMLAAAVKKADEFTAGITRKWELYI